MVKFFTPDSSWSWYGSEFDGEDIFFGLVIGFVAEFGYFSLSELESVRGPLGLPIERDEHFEPKSLKELRDHYDEKGMPCKQVGELVPDRLPQLKIYWAQRCAWKAFSNLKNLYHEGGDTDELPVDNSGGQRDSRC